MGDGQAEVVQCSPIMVTGHHWGLRLSQVGGNMVIVSRRWLQQLEIWTLVSLNITQPGKLLLETSWKHLNRDEYWNADTKS